MKILIIDDEDDIRRIARLGLGKVGKMDVVEANSGPDGVRKAEEEKPDAILLDVMMPVMDGPSTLAALKDNPATAGIPIIFLTAKAMASEIERLKKLGALGVITKPFDPMAFPSQVRSMLEGK
jgi:two-component system, OmpR family, response regulator